MLKSYFMKEMPSKILYLDNDVVAKSSFKEFYNIDNSEYEIVGARIFTENIFIVKTR